MSIPALDRIRNLGPIFRAKEAVDAGVSWRDLYRLRDDGDLVELSRGLYQLAEAAGTEGIDFVTVSARASHGMVCLNSALAYWNLSDEIPSTVHLAVPEGSHRPVIDHPPTTVHVFSASTFDLGRIEITLDHGERFQISDRERTIVDTFRLRHLVGEDLANAALRRYAGAHTDLPRLAEYARVLRSWSPIAAALRVLQA
ncbi:MAG: type IV toxin-antitoxin system AbiEi family antitoxin domain-containing protein [Actinobacteria bacterium]|nr:type IV toxin-antitoxin system AbiEi family antitoxin domain-containing protein [Actinomycetota bacterium]